MTPDVTPEVTPHRIVVMGVCGCGKSVLGEQLARSLLARFVEGDGLHPPANIARMRAGVALGDADRAGWLDACAAALQAAQSVVLACSALKRSYRDRLRVAAPRLRFIHLHGDRAVLERRLAARPGHYMPASLLDGQLAILEAPGIDEHALTFDVAQAPERIVAALLAAPLA